MPAPSPDPTPLCPKCGGPLDPTLLGGGCAACLMGDLIAGEEAELAAGDLPRIDGYELMQEIGHGGMGVVYRARQESSGREVAIKMVARDTLRGLEARRRFLMEVKAMAAVQHPALIPLYDAGEDAHGRPWLAMQFAGGGTLEARLKDYARQWRRSAELLVTLARAVAYAHERGVLHRDLKPANILFDATGHPYVADFGLAKWADEDGSVTRTASVLGSPAYLAPEAAVSGSKATTTVSDVYGLGAILYELLCGARPYEGASVPEIITRIREHSPVAPRTKLAEIPRDLEVIVVKAMAREPGQRYASAGALADDLQRWLDGLPILARPLGPLGRLVSWSRRKPALATLSAVLMLSLAVGSVLLWISYRRLKASLKDVKARVEFMTRELPASLEPLGRLELLDSVFENVAQHFNENPAADADSLARQADFMTQWSQILTPRGDVKGALARLEKALALAKAAAPYHKPASVSIARARVLVGWRMAETLIRDLQHDAAEEVLRETLEFAAQQNTDDLQFRALVAHVTMMPVYVEMKRGNAAGALLPIKESLRLWSALLPLLEADIHTPQSQRFLITAARAHTMLAEVCDMLKDAGARDAACTEALAATARLTDLAPDNFQFRYRRAATLMLVAGKTGSRPTEKLKLVEEAERHLKFLMEHDAGNIEWRITATEAALRQLQWAKEINDTDGMKHWGQTAADRIEPLYRTHCTDVTFLAARARHALICGNYAYESKDWAQTREHWGGAMRALRQMEQMNPSPANRDGFKSRVEKCVRLLSEATDPDSARAWQAEIENKP